MSRTNLSVVALLAVTFLIVVACWVLYRLTHSPRPPRPPLVTIEWIRGGPTSKAVILFVHGIGGNAIDTWGRRGSASTWIDALTGSDDYSEFGVGVVNYETGIFNLEQSIPAISKLVSDRIEEMPQPHQLIFVAHSLGGVICRNAISLSRSLETSEQSVLLVSMGSPFQGSTVADAGIGLLPSSIRSEQLSELGSHSAVLRQIADFWAKTKEALGDRLQQCAVHEKAKMSTLPDLVVSYESATDGVPEGDRIPAIGFDHVALGKPETVGSDFHKKVMARMLYARGFMMVDGKRRIGQSIERPPGSLTIIKPGATLFIESGAVLRIRGKLVCAGEPTKHITIQGPAGRAAEGAIMLAGKGTAGSSFEYCDFLECRGSRLQPPAPKRREILAWDQVYGSQPRGSCICEGEQGNASQSFGGAVTVACTTNISFRHCTFIENSCTSKGGAVCIYGSERIGFYACRFERNSSGFGGGAIHAQLSHLTIHDKCEFIHNTTGPAASPVGAPLPAATDKFASGGAIYFGYGAVGEIRDARFSGNCSSWAGGAIYMLDTHVPEIARAFDPILVAGSVFDSNACQPLPGNPSAPNAGNAMRVDGGTRVLLAGSVSQGTSSIVDETKPGMLDLTVSTLLQADESSLPAILRLPP